MGSITIHQDLHRLPLGRELHRNGQHTPLNTQFLTWDATPPPTYARPGSLCLHRGATLADPGSLGARSDRSVIRV